MDTNTQLPTTQPIQQAPPVQPDQVQQTIQPILQDQQIAPSQTQAAQQTSQNALPSQPVQDIPVQPAVAAQPVQQNPLLPQQNMQSPVSTHVGKEAAPLITPMGNEYASQAPEVALHPEVAAVGVEVNPHPEAVITQDAQTAGVTPVKTAQQVPTESKLKLPLSEDKVESILKAPRKNPMNSLLWLATLVKKIMQKEEKKGEQNGSLIT